MTASLALYATAHKIEPVRCEARVGFEPGDYGELPLWCSARMALIRWTDGVGKTHHACRHHVKVMQRRYPPADGQLWMIPKTRPAPVRSPSIERFLAHVSVGDTPDACWQWTGAKTKGYGVFRDDHRTVAAHRWAYEHYCGPIPDGLHIDHLCRTPTCVNPAHLEPVTQRENNLRGNGWSGRHARQTHCLRGHEYTPENTYRNKGKRYCRECHRAKAADQLRKLRAAAAREDLDRGTATFEAQRVAEVISIASRPLREFEPRVIEEGPGYVVTADMEVEVPRHNHWTPFDSDDTCERCAYDVERAEG